MAFQCLTILSKAQRVSRMCDPDTLVAESGFWVELVADGSVDLVGATATKIAKLLYNGNSGNMYESHDVSLGRITTLETVGARISVTSDFLVGAVAFGDDLYVAFNQTPATDNGKLSSAQTTGAGSYNIVAKCEQLNADGSIEYSIVSPVKLTLGA